MASPESAASIPENSYFDDLEIKPGAIKIWLYDLLVQRLPDKQSALMIANAVAYPLAERINVTLKHKP